MSIDNSSNSEKLYLSIDIGGSAIKYGVLDETFSFVYNLPVKPRESKGFYDEELRHSFQIF